MADTLTMSGQELVRRGCPARRRTSTAVPCGNYAVTRVATVISARQRNPFIIRRRHEVLR